MRGVSSGEFRLISACLVVIPDLLVFTAFFCSLTRVYLKGLVGLLS